jgi:hypothetical protein
MGHLLAFAEDPCAAGIRSTTGTQVHAPRNLWANPQADEGAARAGRSGEGAGITPWGAKAASRPGRDSGGVRALSSRDADGQRRRTATVARILTHAQGLQK